MTARTKLACIVASLATALLLAACSVAPPAPTPKPKQLLRPTGLAGEWFLVEGESAHVLRLEPDGAGIRYEAMLGALRGELPGMSQPRPFRYSVADGAVALDFEDEPDVTLEVSSVTGDTLVVEDATADDWVGTWHDDFE